MGVPLLFVEQICESCSAEKQNMELHDVKDDQMNEVKTSWLSSDLVHPGNTTVKHCLALLCG